MGDHYYWRRNLRLYKGPEQEGKREEISYKCITLMMAANRGKIKMVDNRNLREIIKENFQLVRAFNKAANTECKTSHTKLLIVARRKNMSKRVLTTRKEKVKT